MKKLFLLSIAAGLCTSVAAQVANPKISQLPAASSVTGTEQAPINQGGTTKRVTLQQIANLAPNSYTQSLVFNAATGFLSIDRNSLSTLTAGIDGRYIRHSDTVAMLSPYLRSGLAAVTYVPATRTITINGVTHDLSANVSFTISTGSFDTTGMGLASRFWVGANYLSQTSAAATYAPLSHQHSAADIASGILSVTRGGTGTATPGIIAGTGISVSGTWPNQTITFSGAAGGSPGGSNTQVQFNNSGAFGGSSKFIYDPTNFLLTVGSTTSGAGALTAYGNATTFPDAFTNSLELTGQYPAIWLHPTSIGYGNYIGSANGSLYFSTTSGATSTGVRLLLTSSGDFGIGTSAPSTKLHVNGAITADDAIYYRDVAVAPSAPSSGCVTYASAGHYYIICQGESSATMLH